MEQLQELDKTVLMVIDVQENHFPHCVDKEPALDTMVRVVEAAKVLEVPIVVTEHYPKVFGPTVGPLAEATAGIEPLAKLDFSCLGDAGIAARIEELGAERLVLVGTETHICICQTALMALERGFKVAVVADAVTGRRPRDHELALDRLRAHHVDVLPWESLVYEWLRRGSHPAFRSILPIVKR